ncbi:MAG: hypothetical protein H0W41_03860, partial [Chloroflexi bacterium]|nr:hypothetical protein [Chloroflexota bacterium]
MTRRRGGGGGGGWAGGFGGSDPDLTRRPGTGAKTLRLIAGFFRPYQARLGLISLLILVTVSVGVVNPILLKLIIDNLLPGGEQDLGLLYFQAGL